MKKLIALFLGLAMLSCSSEDQVNQESVSVDTSGSVLDGKMLSFKNEESFTKEYSDLTLLNNNELKNWVSSKKLVSLQETINSSEGIEEDIVKESRLVYSDVLASIFNYESKVKIGDNVVWLNKRTFYLLSKDQINKSSEELVKEIDELIVYGQLLSAARSEVSLTSRNVLPNENRIKTFATPEMTVGNSRLRHVLDLYNETIVFNNAIQTSKMYLRSILQYRSCSTIGGCKWKEAMNLRRMGSNFCQQCNGGAWGVPLNISSDYEVSGTQTYLLSSWRLLPIPAHPDSFYPNFYIGGPVTCRISGSNPVATFSTELSWY